MALLRRFTAALVALKQFEEYVLAGLFFVVGCYAYIDARSWGFAAGTWPRLTSGVVIVLSALVLLQDVLPRSIRSLISDGDTMFSRRQKEAVGDDTPSTDHDEPADADDEPISPAVTTALFTVGFAVLGYLVGFLWATPAFVLAYGYWNRIDWSKSAVLAIVGFAIAYGFSLVLGVPIHEGVLTEGIVP
ncbi:tripartite tricarboxylate transporter TctB family protein [Natrarchaeobius sp. A-rgal3]|uniref:tripartite tricarboxylate transporter TctB family protein n=1 Tax=Natrarchaeobius versutus TaxID=1679078 RepID=UPI00350F707A